MIRAAVRIMLDTSGAVTYGEIQKMCLSEFYWIIQELGVYASQKNKPQPAPVNNSEVNIEELEKRIRRDPAITMKG